MQHVTEQQKPDFSGEWTLNVQASTLSPIVAPAAQSGVLRIEHHEPSLKCQMTIVLDGKPFESKFELLSDSREVAATDGGRRIVSSLRWDGDALVAAWQIEIPNGEMTIAFRYEQLRPAGAGFERRNSSAAGPGPGQCVGVRAGERLVAESSALQTNRRN